jgi:hypothetical protein
MGPGPLDTAWDLDLITASVRDAAPRLIYAIRSEPTGGLLDGPERLVALARRTGTPLVIAETLTDCHSTCPHRRRLRRSAAKTRPS